MKSVYKKEIMAALTALALTGAGLVPAYAAQANDPNNTIVGNAKVTSTTGKAITGAVAVGGATITFDPESAVQKQYNLAPYGWGMIAAGDGATVQNSYFGVMIGAKGTVKDSPFGVAVGGSNDVSNSYGSSAFGSAASAVNSVRGTAIGAVSKVINSKDSVALGAGSMVVGRNNTVSFGRTKEDLEAYNAYVDQYNEEMDKIHNGDKNYHLDKYDPEKNQLNRQITGVADGTEGNDVTTVNQVNRITNMDATKGQGVQYDAKDAGNGLKETDFGSVTFTGVTQKVNGKDVNVGTKLANVNDISVNVPVYEQTPAPWAPSVTIDGKFKGYESRSFLNAGLVPGTVSGGNSTTPSNIVIGRTANSSGVHSGAIIVGDHAEALVDEDFSNNPGGNTSPNDTIVFGTNAKSHNSAQSITIGTYSGTKASNWATAVGADSHVNNSYLGNAFGGGATVDNSQLGTALGYSSHVSDARGSVALGAQSVATGRDANQQIVSVGHKSNDKDLNGNVYGKDLFRQITNVADGTDAHDAATVGQLKNAADGALKWDSDGQGGYVTGNLSSVKNLLVNGRTYLQGQFLATDGDANLGVTNGTVKMTAGTEGAGVAVTNKGTVVTGNTLLTGGSTYVDGSFQTVKGESTLAVNDNGAALQVGQDGLRVTKDNAGLTSGRNQIVLLGDLGTTIKGGNASMNLSDNGIVLNGGLTVTAKDSDGNSRLLHVADGQNQYDAVNKGQLDAVKTTAEKGFTVSVAQPNGKFQTHTYKPGDTVTVTGKNANILAGVDDKTGVVNVALNDNIKISTLTADDITLGGNSFVKAGLVPGTISLPGQNANNGENTAIGNGANVTVSNANGYGQYNTAVGANATVKAYGSEDHASNSSAFGAESSVAGNSSSAFGAFASVTGDQGVAVGYKASAGMGGKNGSTAVGDEASANVAEGTVLGHGSLAGSDNSTAIGSNAQVGSWDFTGVTKGSVALGANSNVDTGDILSGKDTNGVVSVGATGSFQRRIINVADGQNQYDAVNKGQLDAVSNNVTGLAKGAVQYDQKADGTFDYNSVTFKGDTVLKHVADIELGGKSFLQAGLVPGTAYGKNNIAIGDAEVGLGDYEGGTNENAIAIGNGSQVTGDKSVALGYGSQVSAGEGSVAIGDGAQARDYLGGAVAIGRNAYATYDYTGKTGQGVAIGADSFAEGNVVSFGHSADDLNLSDNGKTYGSDLNRRLIHVADGVAKTDAATVGQVEQKISDATKNSVQWDQGTTNTINGVQLEGGKVTANAGISAGNSNFNVDDQGNVNIGKDDKGQAKVTINSSTGDIHTAGTIYTKDGEVASKTYVDGKISGVTNDVTALKTQVGTNTAAITQNKKDIASNTAAIAANKTAIEANATHIGDVAKYEKSGIKDDKGNAVTNVVDATISNKNAITAVDTKVGSGKLDNGSSDLTAGINENYKEIQQNRNAIGVLDGRVNKLGNEVDSVGAISSALAGLHPLSYNAGDARYQLSAAVGTYDGTQALALGGFYNVNKDVLLSLGLSSALNGDHKTAGNLGITFRVGSGASEAQQPATPGVGNDILQRLAAMDQKINALEQENEDLKNQVKALTAAKAAK